MNEPVKDANAYTNENAFGNMFGFGISKSYGKGHKHHYQVYKGECCFVIQVDEIPPYIMAITF